jgi:hypothetical protein|eukprot:scaffold779_cov205-Alexandrium_tamarense.AAC.21
MLTSEVNWEQPLVMRTGQNSVDEIDCCLAIDWKVNIKTTKQIVNCLSLVTLGVKKTKQTSGRCNSSYLNIQTTLTYVCRGYNAGFQRRRV